MEVGGLTLKTETVTIVVALASDLLSPHDKYLVVWNRSGLEPGTGGSCSQPALTSPV